MKIKMKCIAKLLIFFIVFSSFQIQGSMELVNASTDENETRTLNYADSPADNPIKGFAGYRGTGGYSDFPLSIEFVIMPISEIVVGQGQYDWSVLENYLNQVAAYGRQSVVSFYLDNPGTEIGVDAIPEYLLNNGLEYTEYTMPSATTSVIETGYSPDYSNQELWDMIYDFVDELGEKYDGDARIVDIEASIVGFWGEWHTAPYKFGLEDSDLIQLAKAYDKAFNQTQISIRYPKEGTSDLNVGYSDYSFCYETIVDPWSQLNRLKQYNATDYWKTNIGGGELMPPFVRTIFGTENWSLRDGESYEECLQALHPTWLLVGSVHTYALGDRDQAIKAARKLGYDFTVTQATFANDITSTTDKMNVSLNIKNLGIAPFYYKWKVKVGVLNESGKIIKTYGTSWDITQIAADENEYTFKGALPNLNLEKGKYSLAVLVENPLINGKKLKFANETQRSDGWMVLGDLTVDGYTSEDDETPETLPTSREKYGLDVSAMDFQEVLVKTNDYIKVGVRVRNYGTSNYTGSEKPIMKFYRDDTLVRELITDWNLSKINSDSNNYFSWYLKGLEVGEYDITLQLTSDTAEISLGKMNIVNSLDDVNQVDDQLIDYISEPPENVPTPLEKYNLDVTETYYPEELVVSSDYFKVGLRIKNYGTSNYTGSDKPVMRFYKDGTLVQKVTTDWILSNINPNVNHYFSWHIKGLGVGEYDLTLQLTSDTAEVSLGKMNIVNPSDDIAEVTKDKTIEPIVNDTIEKVNKEIIPVKIKVNVGSKKKLTSGQSNKSIIWKNSNHSYASVNSAGVFLAKKSGAGKSVTVTAIHKSTLKEVAKYKVAIQKNLVKKIKVSSTKRAKVGNKVNIEVSYFPSKYVLKKCSFTSSNKRYATVNSKGVVRVKKAGKGKTVKIRVSTLDGSNIKKTIMIKII